MLAKFAIKDHIFFHAGGEGAAVTLFSAEFQRGSVEIHLTGLLLLESRPGPAM